MDAKFLAFVETEVIRKEGDNWQMRKRIFHSFKKYVIGLHHAEFIEMLEQYFKHVRKNSENGFLRTIAEDLTERTGYQVRFIITETNRESGETGNIFYLFEGGLKLELTVHREFFAEEYVRLHPQHLWTLGHEIGHFLVWLGIGDRVLDFSIEPKVPFKDIEPLPTILALTENFSLGRDDNNQMQRSFGLLVEELCDFAGFAFLEHLFRLGVRDHMIGYCQSRKCWVHAEKPKV
jgi:hypothetical protein